MAIPYSELQKINPSTIVELFELEIFAALHGSDYTYRFHAGTNALATHGDIVWAGNTYSKYPIEVEGFEYKSDSGTLPRPLVRVSNLFGSITAILLDVNNTTPGNDLTGAKLTRIRTLMRYIDDVNFEGGSNPYGTADSSSKMPDEIFFIARKTAENRDLVEFEAAAVFDLQGVRSPKRQCHANLCPWIYRGSECGYSGTDYFDENDNVVGNSGLDKCGKRLSSCQIRFGENNSLPFGGFPGIGAFNG